MKKIIVSVLFISLLGGLAFSSGERETDEQKPAEKKLVIYAYDSFVSDWGPAGKIVPVFREETGIEVEFRSAGDAGQVLSRAILEKDSPKADIILGIDNNLLSRALEADILDSYVPGNVHLVPEELRFDPSGKVIPFDYGFFSIIYDSRKISDPPASLEDLTREEFEKSLIIMDPRTSSPGLGFLLWTVKVYGEKYREFWERLKPSILTVTDGWDSGYGLFTAGEAPMVVSYTTSPAYHVEFEETERYKAALFEGGHYMQIEGMGILKGAPHRKEAEAFIEFMVTDSFQQVIPLTNFMFPVNQDTVLPASFDFAPKPENILLLGTEEIRKYQEEWLTAWTRILSE